MSTFVLMLRSVGAKAHTKTPLSASFHNTSSKQEGGGPLGLLPCGIVQGLSRGRSSGRDFQ